MSGSGERQPGTAQWRVCDVEEAKRWIAVPSETDDKYSRGVLGVITGSDQYPGAAVLGVDAAVRTGVGMVRYVGGMRAQTLVLQRRPEVVTGMGRVQAWLAGSGLDPEHRDDSTTSSIVRAFGEGVPTVVDSGALDLIDRLTGPAVITPHFRELSAVLARREIAASPEEIAERAGYWAERSSDLLGLTVLLKGHTTYVASPGGERLSAQSGPSWLATAGSGDVLAGILGALAATHAGEIAKDGELFAPIAVAAAVLHGLAAQRASSGGPIASLDVAEAMPALIAGLLGER